MMNRDELHISRFFHMRQPSGISLIPVCDNLRDVLLAAIMES